MNTKFAARLSKAMEDKDITASELSRLSGVGKPDIHCYLIGKYMPKQKKCLALANALNVDFNWLMFGNEPYTKEEIDEFEELVRLLERVSPENRKMLRKIILTFVEEESK